MTGLRAITRLAIRESRRRPWRSLLVVALIALPTAGAVFVSTWLRTSVDTPEEQLVGQIGQADYVVDASFGPDSRVLTTAVEEIRASLSGQPGVRFIELGIGSGLIATDRGPRKRIRAGVADLPLADPIARGMFTLADGRVPTAPSEVAVDEKLLARMGKGVGDSITMLRPDRTVRVTGSLEPGSFTYGGAIVGSGLGLTTTIPPRFLVALSGGATLPPIRDAERGVATSRATLLQSWDATESNDTLFLYVFGALGMAAFGLIVSSALAVGARRQLRALGLVTANGASPRQARTLILMQGVVLGAVGAVVGVISGLVAAALARPLVERLLGNAEGPLTISLVDCVVIAVLALAVAIGAAWGPARTAARTSVLHALGGRRPLSKLGMRVPLAGLVVSAIGCAILAWAVAAATTNRDTRALIAGVGSAVIVAGLVVCMPYLVGLLDRLAAKTSGTLRLAARTVARQRSRTGPTAAAIMAAGALTLAVATVSLSEDARNREFAYTPYLPDNVVQINASVETLGASYGTLSCAEGLAIARPLLATVLPNATQTCASYESGVVSGRDGFGIAVSALAVDDIPMMVSANVRAALARGDAVFIGDVPPVASFAAARGDAVRVASEPASGTMLSSLIGGGSFIVSKDVAARLDLAERITQTFSIASTPGPITGAQRRALDRLNELDPGADLSTAERDVYVSFNYERGPGAGSEIELVIYAVILPAAILLALLTALIGLALTAAETRDEQATAVAVGAGPRHRRLQNAWQAVLVVGLGVLLAIPGGLVPAGIILSATGVSGSVIVIPWMLLVALLIALPLLAAAGAAVLTKARMNPLSRRAV